MVAKFVKICSRLGRGEEGQAIVVIALLFTALCAFTALGVDGAMWYYQKTRMQAAADAASSAGTYEMSRNWNGSTISATVATVRAQANTLAQANGFPTGQNVTLTFLDSNGQPLATQPTTTIASNTRGVKVSVQQNYSTSFASIFGFSSLPVTTAGAGVFGAASGLNAFPLAVGGDAPMNYGVTWKVQPPGGGGDCSSNCVNFEMFAALPTQPYPTGTPPSVPLTIGGTQATVSTPNSQTVSYINSLISADPFNTSCSSPVTPSPRIVFLPYVDSTFPASSHTVLGFRALLFLSATSSPSTLITGCWVRVNAASGTRGGSSTPYAGVTVINSIAPP